ncbi:MAG: ABC transporter substrate-binding protein [Dehalococcoidales bacterium]
MKNKISRKIFALIMVAALGLIAGGACAAEPDVKPILLGAPLSTGFVDGWDGAKGIELAIEEINADGGVNVGGEMRPFAVEIMDTRDLEPGVPVSEALLVVEKLILDKKVDFIIGGPVRSEAALAVMDILSDNKMISIVSTGVLTPAFHARIAEEYDKYKYSFRITSDIVWLIGETIAILEDIRAEKGFDKVYIMVQDVAHARKAGEIVEGGLVAKGWNIVGNDIYPTGTTDYSIGMLKAKDAGAQILFIWMDMPESAIVLKQWYDLEVPALPIGFIRAAQEPGFWDATDGKGQYAVSAFVNAGNAPSEASPWTMDFIKAHVKKFGLEPEGYGTSSSYMAVYALKEAIERAGTLDSDAVVTALEKTDIMGVYGRIRFNPENHQIINSNDPAEGAVGLWAQWQDGERVGIFPPSVAIGTLQYPPWMK